MARHVVLLRGINLVRRNRIAMPALRAALEAAGFRDVVTYLQSGNVIVSSRSTAPRVAAEVRSLVEERFGFDLTVLIRSGSEMSTAVRRNPLRGMATNPRRHVVTFLSHELPAGFADELRAVATQEPFAIVGREVYSWHPHGIGRTPLWERLASRSLDVGATSRNWATVTALASMAQPIDDR